MERRETKHGEDEERNMRHAKFPTRHVGPATNATGKNAQGFLGMKNWWSSEVEGIARARTDACA